MTFLDKLRKEHPEFVNEKYPGGVALCPEDCGYEEKSVCAAMESGQFNPAACMECWDREIGEERTDCHTGAAALVRNDGEAEGGADGV